MVFYRKYRPQTIDELDSKPVREALLAILASPEPPHAFLFTGPKGLGKTSTARIFAKAINCTGKKKGSIEPCNTCEMCVSITTGSNVDIVEIDGASNRNIDDVRDLKEKIKLSPASAQKKVYIIDEVHMFTTESFNALLKTLEEPPAHAMFILCTTERQKVPATIASRSFVIQFQPATLEEITRSFKRIAAGEKIHIEDDAIAFIAELADGGFRDAHKILEELVGLSADKKITKALVEQKYHVVSNKQSGLEIIQSLIAKDVKKGLSIVQQLVSQGVDIRIFLLELVEQMHSILLQKAGVEKDVVASPLYTELSLDEIKSLLVLLTKAYGDMKYAVLPQLPLELAIVGWGMEEEIQATDASHEIIVEEKVTLKTTDDGVTVASMRKQLGDLARVKALYGEPKPVKADGGNAEPAIDLTQISNTEITPAWLQHFWNSFIAEVKAHNHTLAGVLRGCMIQNFDKKSLIIETAYKFHKERLEDTKTKLMLEEACKTLTGNSISVEVRLKK